QQPVLTAVLWPLQGQPCKASYLKSRRGVRLTSRRAASSSLDPFPGATAQGLKIRQAQVIANCRNVKHPKGEFKLVFAIPGEKAANGIHWRCSEQMTRRALNSG